MYKATYKCRMCGETFTGNEADSMGLAMLTILEFPAMSVSEKQGGKYTEYCIHKCKDGSIGYADFVGFRSNPE